MRAILLKAADNSESFLNAVDKWSKLVGWFAIITSILYFTGVWGIKHILP